MNDKDKEAFYRWWTSNKYELSPFYWSNTSLIGIEIANTWQAACGNKDKELMEWKEAARSEAEEVNRLQADYRALQEEFSLAKTMAGLLQAENKRMREALEYLNTITVLAEKVKPVIREALKEAGEK